MNSVKKRLFVGIGVLLIIIVSGFYLLQGRNKANKYETMVVDRGDIVEKITATGTINPVISVKVGSQVSGRISKIYADFNAQVKKGDVIVAGNNFGCGSSREHSPVAIKASGISAVIAKSFARIFFRNSINIGLPLFITKEADEIDDGDEVEINIKNGKIYDKTKDIILKANPLPEFMQKIVDKGGLIDFLRSGGYDNI